VINSRTSSGNPARSRPLASTPRRPGEPDASGFDGSDRPSPQGESSEFRDRFWDVFWDESSRGAAALMRERDRASSPQGESSEFRDRFWDVFWDESSRGAAALKRERDRGS